MKEIFLTGLSHRTASVDVREGVSYSEEMLPEILERIYNLQGVSGVVIFSTCNRTEFLLNAESFIYEEIKKILAERLSMDIDSLTPMLYLYRQNKAVKHLFRVASALDSMVLGEPQILGQVKKAFRTAFDIGVTDTFLNLLMQRSFNVAKKVRAETGIGESAVSVSYAAVEIAKKIFGNLDGKKCMVIGAGEMCELAVRHLVENGVEEIFVLNRTLTKAEELASSFGGTAHSLDALVSLLPDADVVISSTGSRDPIITKEMLAATVKARRYTPQLVVDIAVPRDVEEDAKKLSEVYLYDIDDLQYVVDENLKERENQAEEAEKMVAIGVDRFMSRLSEFSIVPAIQELKDKMETVRQAELKRCYKGMGELDESQRKTLERFSTSLLNKFLHQPIIQMKDFSGEEHAVSLIRRIFGLKEE